MGARVIFLLGNPNSHVHLVFESVILASLTT